MGTSLPFIGRNKALSYGFRILGIKNQRSTRFASFIGDIHHPRITDRGINMVSNVLGLTNNGLRDWVIQRVSAVVLAAYMIFLVGFCIALYPVNFIVWQGLFMTLPMKIFTLLALLSLVLHAWIGMWTVLTDYIKNTALQITLMMGIILSLLACFIWGIFIVWGI